jgi:N-acetylmuramoyl-L-alanine amidase
MNRKIIGISFSILSLIVLIVFQLPQFHPAKEQETFSKNIFGYGAYGSDVFELQGRLKFIGYYNGDLDGDFGYLTLTAVKRFQGEFGMKVDGIVGSSTKLKIWESTKAWKPTESWSSEKQKASASGEVQLISTNRLGVSSQEINLMANAVHGESRGEPYIGQVAVAAVILNRLNSGSFPNTISGVIFQPGAFTAVDDGQIWLTPNETAKKAVRDAINGWDPSEGCIYYFNPSTATSKWIWTRVQVKQIGKHIFCI